MLSCVHVINEKIEGFMVQKIYVIYIYNQSKVTV